MQKKNNFNFKLFLATRKYLAISISCIVAATFFLIFLAYPRISELKNLNKKISSENKKLEKYQAKIRDLSQITKLKEFQNKRAINAVLPSHKPLLELLNNLNKIAKNNQIALENFDLSPGEIASQGAEIAEIQSRNKTSYDSMEINFTAKGQLENLDNFLKDTERMSPITSIKNISLKRKEKEKDGKITIYASSDLTLATYYYTQSVKASLESPLPKIGSKELEIFATILNFEKSDLKKQTEIKDGGNENIFGIDGWEQLQEEAKKEAGKSQLQEYLD